MTVEKDPVNLDSSIAAILDPETLEKLGKIAGLPQKTPLPPIQKSAAEAPTPTVKSEPTSIRVSTEGKPNVIKTPEGCLGLIRVDDTDLDTRSIEKIGGEEYAYIAIPDIEALRPLVDPHYGRKPGSPLLGEAEAFLKKLFEDSGWKAYFGFTGQVKEARLSTDSFKEKPQMSSLWVVPFEETIWALPPGKIYPIDFPKKIALREESLPEGSLDIGEKYLRQFNVQVFPQPKFYLIEDKKKREEPWQEYEIIRNGKKETILAKRNIKNPGSSWIAEVGSVLSYVCFSEKMPNLSNENGYWTSDEKGKKTWMGEWIEQEWVIRKTPEAVKQYLIQRFGAILDIKIGKIIAPPDRIGQIIGKKKYGIQEDKNHLNILEEIVGHRLTVIPSKNLS